MIWLDELSPVTETQYGLLATEGHMGKLEDAAKRSAPVVVNDRRGTQYVSEHGTIRRVGPKRTWKQQRRDAAKGVGGAGSKS